MFDCIDNAASSGRGSPDHMALQHDDSTPKAPAARPRGWLRAAVVGAVAVAVRRCGRGLHRLSLAIAWRRDQAGAQRRRDRGADRRLVAGVGCDGIAGRRLRQSGC